MGATVVMLKVKPWSRASTFHILRLPRATLWVETVLDIKRGTKPVKLGRAGRAAFASSKEPLGELFSVICEYR